MSDMNLSDYHVNDKVKYLGQTRPYLKSFEGVITSGPSASGGFLVEFTRPGSTLTYTEWVGYQALLKVGSDPITEARTKVQERIKELEKKISDLRSEISKLNAANKALKDMQ